MARKDQTERTAFSISAFLIVFVFGVAYGVLAFRNNLFPLPLLSEAGTAINLMLGEDQRHFVFDNAIYDDPVATAQPGRQAHGLILVSESMGGRETAVRVIDRSGGIVHEWRVALSDVWSDTGIFPDDRRPEGGYGMYLHGIALLPDGGFVANFEHLSTFRMDACGTVMWKRDNLGHHSVHLSDDGTLYVSGERAVLDGATGFANHVAPFRSWTIEQMSLEGETLREIEVADILRRNHLEGWLYLRAEGNADLEVSGDSLHLNDVETFPRGMASDLFDPGDLMISLRDINAILVVDPETLRVKYKRIGQFVRQHDPDFLPGDRISVYDNFNLYPRPGHGAPHSRIVEINARTGASKVVVSGDGDVPFFSNIMGKHQRLANGNILVVSSSEGRVFEFAPDGGLVWHYANRLDDGTNARIYAARVLPQKMDAAFFRARRQSCRQVSR